MSTVINMYIFLLLQNQTKEACVVPPILTMSSWIFEADIWNYSETNTVSSE